MADGLGGPVLRKSDFYEGTWAVEIHHPGLGIVRYGELDPSGIIVSEGEHVKKGQWIGRVGRRWHATRYMLHLELFSDWSDSIVDRRERGSHPLSVNHQPPYNRRSDVHNPTYILMSAPLQNMNGLTFNDTRREADRQKLVSTLRHVSLATSVPSGVAK